MSAASVDRIAHYRILRRVGRGGMGIVYRAVDERDGREVALKVIRGSEAASDESAPHVTEARERFTREAEILKGLMHVNVVSFYEIGEEDGTPYLAMEFLDGRPIGSFSGKPYTETLPLFVQAAHGLAYLASRGIVHRDLSPDNIFVVDKGGDRDARLIKLLDFGVAKLFETPTGGLESLTATGFFLGKVAYGSPEQLGYLGHGAPLDWRSDVYSLGVIFYEVLAGHRPFEGKAPVEYIAAHLNTPPPPVAAALGAPPLPVALVRLIGQMLEKRREERPKSWRAIVDGLVTVLRDAGRTTLLSSDEPADPKEPTRPTELVISRETPSAVLLPRRTPLSSPLARSAVGLVLLAVAMGLLLVRELTRKPRESAPTSAVKAEAQPAAAAASGQLRLLATPYARVESVTDLKSGRGLPLASSAETPYLMPVVPPGRYRVVLSCPSLDGRRVEREVSVSAGQPALVAEAFLSPEALAETLR